MTINESIYAALSVSDASGVSPLLMGNPGAGKTTSVEFFAKANDMRMVLLRGSQSSPEEILGYEVNDGEGSMRGNIMVKKASKICPKWYDELLEWHEKGVRTLLFLDEITTASAFVQSALLQVIFGREIDNGYPLPDDTFVVAAGNYSGNLSSEFNLIPPLMNRFCIFNVTITADDLTAFMSRYRSKQDIVSKLRIFDAANSTNIDSLDPKFVADTKSSMELSICNYAKSLISSGKFDPNITEMSDIYQDQSLGSKLYGFLTPRTLNYYRDTAIYMYLKYGSTGIESDTFREMTNGLVGISLSKAGKSKNDPDVRKNMMTEEFIQVVKSVATQMDKKRIKSVASIEEQLDSVIGNINENTTSLSSADMIKLSKIFESAMNDASLAKVVTPISPDKIIICSDTLIKTARNTLRGENSDKIMSLMNSGDFNKSEINLENINGEIKKFNDVLNAYRSMSEFLKVRAFKYGSDVIKSVTETNKSVLGKNRYRINTVREHLKMYFKVPMTDLVEIANID
jgi:hypothetical protein